MLDRQGQFWSNPAIVSQYKASERVTGPVAKLMIQQCGIIQPRAESLKVLDLACGTGIVASYLHELLEEDMKTQMEMIGGDLSEVMVQAMQERIECEGWKDTKAEIMNAQVRDTPSPLLQECRSHLEIRIQNSPIRTSRMS